MTPIIDIVFLLIIFFMLVCQFIVAENFEVTVPEDISAASISDSQDEQTTTVTIMLNEAGEVTYAVGAEVIVNDGGNISSAIAGQIDEQLQNLPAERRVVCFRADKDVCYRDSQYALAGIDQSSATDIKLAVRKKER